MELYLPYKFQQDISRLEIDCFLYKVLPNILFSRFSQIENCLKRTWLTSFSTELYCAVLLPAMSLLYSKVGFCCNISPFTNTIFHPYQAGYREGISDGQEDSLQIGFNEGFVDAAYQYMPSSRLRGCIR